jgi:hypothetical protein
MENKYKHPSFSNLMNEDLLSRSSDNIATLLQIVLLHEQNLARVSRRNIQENNPLGDLINIVFTSENLRRNSRAARNAVPNTPTEPVYTEHQYSDIITPIYTECPITQEPFQDMDRVVMVRSCRHLFKRNSFHEWISISQTCPYCRSPL